MKSALSVSIIALTLAFGSSAFAKPFNISLSPDFNQQNYKLAGAERAPVDFDFSGIASLPGCSGSIVNLGTPDTALALLMTNGHCLGMMDDVADKVVVDQPYSSAAKAYITIQRSVPVRITKVIYAIMQPHDVALLQLNVTYQQFQAQGVKSYRLSGTQAPVGENLIFASGLFQEVSTCPIVDVVYRLKEDKWLNENVIKYTACDSKHGTSGTPLISATTREIVGINMTGNDDGESCTMNNPCEIDEKGQVTVDQHAGYGDQVSKILSCLNQQKNFDLGVEGCPLPKPHSSETL